MRSDAIDQLLSSYLKVPAKVSWTGALADSARGQFEGGRIELAGIALFALPFDRLVLESQRFQFTPGIPARIAATGPQLILTIDQRQIDLWLTQAGAPFEMTLGAEAIQLRLDVAGRALGRLDTEIQIQNGWFVLRPKHAEFLGIRNRLASLFRSYLPIPRLAPQTRLVGVEHAEGSIRLVLGLDDFEDEITPGLIDRLQMRFIPFARHITGRNS